jgi:hypothetical protein
MIPMPGLPIPVVVILGYEEDAANESPVWVFLSCFLNEDWEKKDESVEPIVNA